jgi:hypothetical protein
VTRRSRRPPWVRRRNRQRLLTVVTIFAGILIVVAAVLASRQSAPTEARLAAVLTTAALTPGASSSPESNDMPNEALTPGAVATTDVGIVCRPGYATSVRPTGALWRHLKDEAYDRYGLSQGHRSMIDAHGVRQPAYEVDHLVPLEIGGDPTDIRNLWPEPIESARVKDEVENELHEMVCSGGMPLAQAQAAIAHDWKKSVPGQQIP